jgi:hypothetical protein
MRMAEVLKPMGWDLETVGFQKNYLSAHAGRKSADCSPRQDGRLHDDDGADPLEQYIWGDRPLQGSGKPPEEGIAVEEAGYEDRSSSR